MSASMSTVKPGTSASAPGAAAASSSTTTTTFGVSSRLQKEKIADVMAMVEREGAVIDAVMKRLDRLNVEY